MADCSFQDMPVCYGVYLILVAGTSYTQPVVYTATRLSFTVSGREQIMWCDHQTERNQYAQTQNGTSC